MKEGDGDEVVKSVTIDGEVLVIESKQKKKDVGMRSKRSTISTVGIPIQFADSVTIVLPSRIADVRLAFPILYSAICSRTGYSSIRRASQPSKSQIRNLIVNYHNTKEPLSGFSPFVLALFL